MSDKEYPSEEYFKNMSYWGTLFNYNGVPCIEIRKTSKETTWPDLLRRVADDMEKSSRDFKSKQIK